MQFSQTISGDVFPGTKRREVFDFEGIVDFAERLSSFGAVHQQEQLAAEPNQLQISTGPKRNLAHHADHLGRKSTVTDRVDFSHDPNEGEIQTQDKRQAAKHFSNFA